MDKRNKNYRRLPIIQNPLKNIRNRNIRKIENVIATTKGGFIEELDYTGKTNFLPYFEVWDFFSAIV